PELETLLKSIFADSHRHSLLLACEEDSWAMGRGGFAIFVAVRLSPHMLSTGDPGACQQVITVAR
ncbi:MAG TPA: hypothetical protein VHH34_16180, partial [Pseudonocardiaceae bacterium]|nr:hypothetical protein [Pseudonocardiaceae bacterium]